MDSTLKVKLSLNTNCELFAFDETDYKKNFADINNFAILEILTDIENNTVLQRIYPIKDISDPILTKSEVIKLKSDGTFNYYKMLVPTFEHYNRDGTHEVAKKVFVYNNEVYYSETNLEIFNSDSVRLITDYREVWDTKDTDNQIFWFTDRFLSICKLQSCLTKKIEVYLKKVSKNGCVLSCTKNDEDKLLIDFLLESVFAINYLASKGKFEDAQRIINSIMTCNGLCKEEDGVNFKYDCNCG